VIKKENNMKKEKAFELMKELSGEYFVLHKTSSCLDGEFTTEQLKAIIYIIENDLIQKVYDEKIRSSEI
jgi:recombinational DNA repair protein RecR